MGYAVPAKVSYAKGKDTLSEVHVRSSSYRPHSNCSSSNHGRLKSFYTVEAIPDLRYSPEKPRKRRTGIFPDRTREKGDGQLTKSMYDVRNFLKLASTETRMLLVLFPTKLDWIS